MISAVFRRSSDVAFVAEELKAVFDPRGGAWMQGRYVPSLLAAIGDIVERHMKGLTTEGREIANDAFPHPFTPAACPQCGSTDTAEVSRFGSTPCKAQWRCNSCLEPFELFKCH